MLLLPFLSLLSAAVSASGKLALRSQSNSLCSTGFQQSPININTEQVVRDCSNMSIELFSVEKLVENRMTMVDGVFTLNTPVIYSFAYVVDSQGATQLFISKEASIHFSSEHTLDGVRYSAELQLLYKTEDLADRWYRSMIVAVVLQETADDNTAVHTMFDGVNLDHPTAFPFSLALITTAIENSTFYFYQGSRTTGNCSEDVLWYVSEVVLPIRRNHLRLIKSMSAGIPNNKPKSQLNQRKVYALNSSCANHSRVAHSWHPLAALPVLLLTVYFLL